MTRRGFVLVAALLVVVLIAVLIAGVFFATMEESHIADTASARDLALDAAESAIQETIASWAGIADQSIGVGGEKLSTFSRDNMAVDVSVTRLDSTLYAILAQAHTLASSNAVTRRIGVVVSVQNSIDNSILIEPIPERWWLEHL
jgi:Tfp pilus assembly protein PilX